MQISWEWRLSILNLLIISNVVIYLLGLVFSLLLFTGNSDQGYTVFHFLAGGASAADLSNGQLWRMTAASFLHAATPGHVLLNMFTLSIIGRRLQELFSGRWLLVFYVFGGTFATALSLPLLPNAYTVGASAAVFAFVGVYLAASYRKRYNSIDLGIDTSELWPFGLMIFFGFFSPVPGVNNYAHILGFLIGAMLGWIVPHALVVKPNKGWKKLETVAYYSSLMWLGFVLIMATANIIQFFSVTL